MPRLSIKIFKRRAGEKSNRQRFQNPPRAFFARFHAFLLLAFGHLNHRFAFPIESVIALHRQRQARVIRYFFKR